MYKSVVCARACDTMPVGADVSRGQIDMADVGVLAATEVHIRACGPTVAGGCGQSYHQSP